MGEQARRGSHIWLERPWEFRYVVIVRPSLLFRRAQVRAQRLNASPSADLYRWEEFFDAIPISEAGRAATDMDVAVSLIEFDRSGQVLTPHRHPGPLRGRINRLRYVTLSAGEGPEDRIFDLGEWFTGLGDASTDWAPAVCSSDEMPEPPGVSDGSSYRYGPRFTHPELTGTFGCREWAFQLYSPDRHYIDVTSYVLGRSGGVSSAVIHDFIGFARFGDTKPVIGQQRGTWYCLLDCPQGAAPGRIADIAAWAGANGWSPPKPPTRAPTFPDPPTTPGTYPH